MAFPAAYDLRKILNRLRILLILCCTIIPLGNTLLFAQPLAPKLKPSLFDSLQTLKNLDTIRLTTPVKQLLRSNPSETYYPAVITFVFPEKTWTMPVEVRLRGHSRRMICTTPPLKLAFDSLTLAEHGLDPRFNKYKLAVFCKNKDSYKELLVKEHLVYSLYETITDMSYRTMLTELVLRDQQGKKKDKTGPAFILEDSDDLACRLEGLKYDIELIHPSKVWDHQELLMAMFQYMVGNTDWNLANGHNIKLYRSYSRQCLVPIPYDFDYSGLVNAPYAMPFHTLPIKSVRERLFLGICRTEQEIREMSAYFLKRREDLYKCVSNHPRLSSAAKKVSMEYLNAFFQELEDIGKLQRKMRTACLD